MKRKIIAITCLVFLTASLVFAQSNRIRSHGAQITINVLGAIGLIPASGQSVAITGPLSVSGAASVNGGATVATGQTLAVTDADKLTVGGVIVPQTLTVTYRCAAAATCGTSHFFVADAAYQVTGVNVVWSTAESTATNLRVQVEKLTGTTAPGSGTALLTNNTNAGVSIKGTANTVTAGTLTATAASKQLAAGNRLGVVFETGPTEGAGVVVTVTLQRI
jgi:hypothetical protein